MHIPDFCIHTKSHMLHYLKALTLGIVYTDSVVLNKEVGSKSLEEMYSCICLGGKCRRIIAIPTYCACIGFVQKIKRSEMEIEFLLAGLAALGTGGEMSGDFTQKDTV